MNALWITGYVLCGLICYVPCVRAFTKHGPPEGRISGAAEGMAVAFFCLFGAAIWPLLLVTFGLGQLTMKIGNYEKSTRKSLS